MSTLFTYLSSLRIAALIRTAERRVCYAAPGIQLAPAQAILEVSERISPDELTVSLDFNESSLRMGYGTLEAVEVLRAAGMQPSHSPGFRSAILIVDDAGWVFTPTAHYLEAEPQSDETPNAIRLAAGQVREMLLHLSPSARDEAIATAPTPAEAARIESIPMEISEQPMDEQQFREVKQAISIAPPVKFDMVRQVRVFEPYLQYVELSLTGAAVQRHRVRIPASLQNLGTSHELEGKLKTTLDLIGKSSGFSSEALEDELKEIRKNFTATLGKVHGRVVLKAAKPALQARLAELAGKLTAHQAQLQTSLQEKLNESKAQVVKYYLPLVIANPPRELTGQLIDVTPAAMKAWLELQVESIFPAAKTLIETMKLDTQYSDVTFETLNKDDFFEAVKIAYPLIDWDKPFDQFRAIGESK